MRFKGLFAVAAWWVLLLVCHPVIAEIRSQDIEYEQGGTKLQGHLVYDDQFSEPRPGVLVVHEWWGINDYARMRANMLAKLGYVAFALDMYGDGKSTQERKQAQHWSGQFRGSAMMRARAMAGLEVLKNHSRVDPDRVAAIGYCFGGTTVMQLAYSGAKLKGVVSFHGSLPLPDEADYAPGRVKAAVLVCHGYADTFIDRQHVLAFQKSLDQIGADWQMIIYGGAQHSFTNPGADAIGIDGLGYDRKADQRSWKHMQEFLQRLLLPVLGD